MTSRLTALGHGVRRTLLGLRSRPIASLLGTGAMGVSLLLIALVCLLAVNISRVAATWGHGVHMVVYLDDDVTPERARAIGSALRGAAGVASIDYVPPDQAYRRLADSLGEHRALLDGVEIGYLPASLEVTFVDGVRDMATVSPLVERLRRVPGVEEVEFLGDWVDRLVALVGSLRALAILVSALVAFAGTYVIASTIKLGVLGRRTEIAVLRLVGASDAFVRAPIVAEGAIQGAAGAGMALGLLYGILAFGGSSFERMLAGGVADARITFLPAAGCLGIVALGVALGVTGGWIAVGRDADA